MKRISTGEFIRNFGTYSDVALSTPIIVTKNGRDRLVLISVEEYDTLRHAYDAFEDTRDKTRHGMKPRQTRGATRRER